VLIAAMALLASALLYGAWFLALFPFHGRRRKPFARAWRELPKLLRKHAHEAAFRVIHRALDHTAGYPMFADRLDVFLEAHPAFAPLRDRLQRFFAASRQLFYAPANRPRPVGANGPYDVASELKELCRLAMELERQ
jgi:mxaA protein